MTDLVLLAKDLVITLFFISLSSILLWFISHVFMEIFKTLFCDTQVKLYKVWKKRLKNYTDDKEVEKVLNEVSKYGKK